VAAAIDESSVNKIARLGIVLLALASVDTSASGVVAAGAHAPYPAAYASAAVIIGRAERGDIAAQARLGWMYSTGRGVPQNFYQAAEWYYRAANQGNGEAQFELAMLYNKGEGVRRDYVLAYMWLNLATSHAMGDDLDFTTRMRDSIAAKMTPEQLQAAQQLATVWYKAH
jgi:uncharacterized protein